MPYSQVNSEKYLLGFKKVLYFLCQLILHVVYSKVAVTKVVKHPRFPLHVKEKFNNEILLEIIGDPIVYIVRIRGWLSASAQSSSLNKT